MKKLVLKQKSLVILQNAEVVGKHGEKVTVDVSIADAKPEDYDGLLIPGGFSPDHLRGDAEGRYGTFAKYFTKNDVPAFAICHGPQILIDTDDLKWTHVNSCT